MILVFRKCANIQTFLQDEVSSVYYIHSDMSDATIPCIHISLINKRMIIVVISSRMMSCIRYY